MLRNASHCEISRSIISRDMPQCRGPESCRSIRRCVMAATAVVGANWGDEGKGKITDVLAAEAEFVVRYQGGNNAGHTIINQFGKFALHLLPSGVFYPHVTNVLGPGVAVNIPAFIK